MNRFRTFLVTDRGRTKRADDGLHGVYKEMPYTEERLRDWAMETFEDIDETSTLEDIAREMQQHSLLLYEGIWPSSPEAEKGQMHRIAEALQGDLEADAESIAEACKGVGARVVTKTMISEVSHSHAVITITVRPAPRKCRKEDIKVG